MRFAPWLIRRRMLAVTVGLLSVGAATTPASAADFSLDLSGPTSAKVGKPIALTATGDNPDPDEWWFASYLQVEAIPASVLSSCPPDYLQGVQVAENAWSAGGQHLAGPQMERVDGSGRWSAPVAFTPTAPGRTLLCGYTQNVSDTLATATHVVDVKAKKKKCKKPKKRAAGAAKRCKGKG